MSNPKHTPGPWRKGNANDCHKIFSGHRVIGSVEGSTRGRAVSSNHNEAQANARLIAAAPEMLEALNWISINSGIASDGNHVNPKQAHAENIKRARAAIAKATGRE